MGTSDGQVQRDAASVYETFFVPALFSEWAPWVADALEPFGAGPALDVACGTGVLARELSRRVGPSRVCGVDCNEGMLAVARDAGRGIDFRLARAEELPFADGACGAVGCQFGLMFFANRARALSEMWRVLAPGGRLVVAVWGPLSDTPGYAAMVELLRSLFGDEVAGELRAPFALGEVSALREVFAQAELPEPTVETRVGTARFPSLGAWIHTDVRGWTLADRIDDAQYARLEREAPAALSRFELPDGRVQFESPAHVVSVGKA